MKEILFSYFILLHYFMLLCRRDQEKGCFNLWSKICFHSCCTV